MRKALHVTPEIEETLRRFDELAEHTKRCKICKVFGAELHPPQFYKLVCETGTKLYRAWFDRRL